MTEQNPYPGQENAGYQAGQQQGQPAGAAPQGGPGVYEYDAFGNPLPQGAKNLAMWAHRSGLLGVIFSAGILSFLGPLIFWLVYKDRPGYGYVRLAAANAFNFNFTLWLIPGCLYLYRPDPGCWLPGYLDYFLRSLDWHYRLPHYCRYQG